MDTHCKQKSVFYIVNNQYLLLNAVITCHFTHFLCFLLFYLVLCKYINTFSLHIGVIVHTLSTLCVFVALYGAALNLMTLRNDNKGILFYSILFYTE